MDARARLVPVVLCLGLLVGPVGPAAADDPVAGATWEQVWFPSADGTMLRADVLLPADRAPDERHPVILAIGPYFGRNAMNQGPEGQLLAGGPMLRYDDLFMEGRIFERGYAFVQVDSRGYGGSGGCNDFGGHGEQMDAAAAVEWAGAQPWSSGQVGMWGGSYDGWTQVMALAENPAALQAVVIQAPLIEAYRFVLMNGVRYAGQPAGINYLVPTLYTLYDLAPTTAGDPEPEEFVYPAVGTATNPDCYAEKTVFTAIPDRSLPYWRERDIVRRAAMSQVPTLWAHGANDVVTKPDNFLDVYSSLSGPKRVWFGQWGHDRASDTETVGRAGFIDEAMQWFDHHLKGLPLPERPGAVVQDSEGAWRSETQWPPADATDFGMPVKPGVYADDASTSEARGIWSISQPAPRAVHIAGTPRLSVDLVTQASLANLVAQLYDIAPDGTARLVSRGAYRLGSSAAVGFDLYPNDWIVRAGHRLGLRLSSYDSMFHTVGTQTNVEVVEGVLSIPCLRWQRNPDLDGGPSTREPPQTTVSGPTIAENTVEAAFPCPQSPRLGRPDASA